MASLLGMGILQFLGMILFNVRRVSFKMLITTFRYAGNMATAYDTLQCCEKKKKKL